ncbi:NAD(+) synthase [Candidatus Poribacteria bacterium]|nr:NAD(+) synthase [Candidatus Poribacteria bacterium]
MQEVTKAITSWLKNETGKNGARGLLLEINPNLESVVIARLAKDTFSANCLGLILPCLDNPEYEKLTVKIAEALQLSYKIINLNSVLNEFLLQLEGNASHFPPPPNFAAAANIRYRLRMTSLYYFADKLNYLVCGTLNKINVTTGSFTKYSSAAVDLLPLGDMYKHQIISMAKDIGISDEIINLTASSNIWIEQTEDAELGLTHNDMDNIIQCLEQKDMCDCEPRLLKIMREKNHNSIDKRKMPKIFKLEVPNLDMSSERFNL